MSQRSKVGEVVLDVLQVDLSSSEWATTLLPAGVLAADLLGEVLRVADLIFTEKGEKLLEISVLSMLYNVKLTVM